MHRLFTHIALDRSLCYWTNVSIHLFLATPIATEGRAISTTIARATVPSLSVSLKLVQDASLCVIVELHAIPIILVSARLRRKPQIIAFPSALPATPILVTPAKLIKTVSKILTAIHLMVVIA